MFECTFAGWERQHSCLYVVEDCDDTSGDAVCVPSECAVVGRSTCVNDPSVEVVATCEEDGFWSTQACEENMTCSYVDEGAECR